MVLHCYGYVYVAWDQSLWQMFFRTRDMHGILPQHGLFEYVFVGYLDRWKLCRSFHMEIFDILHEPSYGGEGWDAMQSFYCNARNDIG